MVRIRALGEIPKDLYNAWFNFFCALILHSIFRSTGISNHGRVDPISIVLMDKRSQEIYFFINHIRYFFPCHLHYIRKIDARAFTRRVTAGDTVIWKTFFRR